jgi:hypothetical protein
MSHLSNAGVFTFPGGIGDQLLCTTVGEALGATRRPRPTLITSHPVFFDRNPHFDVIDSQSDLAAELHRSGVPIQNLSYGNGFSPQDEGDHYHEGHVIQAMCRLAGAKGRIALRPVVYFNPEPPAPPRERPATVVIQSSGVASLHYYPLKDWYPERFSEVAEALAATHRVVQVGGAADPRIEYALDLRGQTTILETFRVLREARLFIGTVGFLMHLARAAETQSVIVYGGREDPRKTGYVCNRNLGSSVPCAPCYRRVKCPHDKLCMNQIGVAQVVAAATELLAALEYPLLTEYVTLL